MTFNTPPATHTGQKSRTAQDPWISTPAHRPDARMRLFCFPYAGGGTSAYNPWAKSLPDEIALYSIRLPGRESRLREAPHVRMAPLVQDLADALSPYLDLPFAFFGHSMGGLVTFELARQLRRQHAPQPLHLFVSSHRAPPAQPRSAALQPLRRRTGTGDASTVQRHPAVRHGES